MKATKFSVINNNGITLFTGCFEECHNYSNRNYNGTMNKIVELN